MFLAIRAVKVLLLHKIFFTKQKTTMNLTVNFAKFCRKYIRFYFFGIIPMLLNLSMQPDEQTREFGCIRKKYINI